jgi:mRNA interferase RelE/StbE
MTYKLTFLESAKKEWNQLNHNTKEQFKAKLTQRLVTPKIPKDKLSGMADCYKIKLRAIGYRLVYKVIDARLVVQVIAIGRRDKDAVYKVAHERFNKL